MMHYPVSISQTKSTIFQLKPVLGGVRDVALSRSISQTKSTIFQLKPVLVGVRDVALSSIYQSNQVYYFPT